MSSRNNDVMVLREFADNAGEFRAIMWTRKERPAEGPPVDVYAHAYMFAGSKRVQENHGTDDSAARRAFFASVDMYLDAYNLSRETEAATTSA